MNGEQLGSEASAFEATRSKLKDELKGLKDERSGSRDEHDTPMLPINHDYKQISQEINALETDIAIGDLKSELAALIGERESFRAGSEDYQMISQEIAKIEEELRSLGQRAESKKSRRNKETASFPPNNDALIEEWFLLMDELEKNKFSGEAGQIRGELEKIKAELERNGIDTLNKLMMETLLENIRLKKELKNNSTKVPFEEDLTELKTKEEIEPTPDPETAPEDDTDKLTPQEVLQQKIVDLESIRDEIASLIKMISAGVDEADKELVRTQAQALITRLGEVEATLAGAGTDLDAEKDSDLLRSLATTLKSAKEKEIELKGLISTLEEETPDEPPVEEEPTTDEGSDEEESQPEEDTTQEAANKEASLKWYQLGRRMTKLFTGKSEEEAFYGVNSTPVVGDLGRLALKGTNKIRKGLRMEEKQEYDYRARSVSNENDKVSDSVPEEPAVEKRVEIGNKLGLDVILNKSKEDLTVDDKRILKVSLRMALEFYDKRDLRDMVRAQYSPYTNSQIIFVREFLAERSKDRVSGAETFRREISEQLKSKQDQIDFVEYVVGNARDIEVLLEDDSTGKINVAPSSDGEDEPADLSPEQKFANLGVDALLQKDNLQADEKRELTAIFRAADDIADQRGVVEPDNFTDLRANFNTMFGDVNTAGIRDEVAAIRESIAANDKQVFVDYISKRAQEMSDKIWSSGKKLSR